MTYLIIGLGTFGSYLYERLKNQNPQCHVIIVNHPQNSKKVDINSSSERMKLRNGQLHLGPGGLSNIWGGNLVLMTRKQFLCSNISRRMTYESYLEYSKKVFSYFKLNPNSFVPRQNYVVQETSWLKIRQRKIETRLRKYDKYFETTNWSFSNTDENKFIVDGKNYYYDHAFVCCGAIENLRILNSVDKRLFKGRKFLYKDHVSFDYKIPSGLFHNRVYKDISHEMNLTRLFTKRAVDLNNISSFEHLHPMLHCSTDFDRGSLGDLLKRLFAHKEYSAMLQMAHPVILKKLMTIFFSILKHKRISFGYLGRRINCIDLYPKRFSEIRINQDGCLINYENYDDEEMKNIVLKILLKFYNLKDSSDIRVRTRDLTFHPVGEFNDKFKWLSQNWSYIYKNNLWPISTFNVNSTGSANSTLTTLIIIESILDCR